MKKPAAAAVKDTTPKLRGSLRDSASASSTSQKQQRNISSGPSSATSAEVNALDKARKALTKLNSLATKLGKHKQIKKTMMSAGVIRQLQLHKADCERHRRDMLNVISAAKIKVPDVTQACVSAVRFMVTAKTALANAKPFFDIITYSAMKLSSLAALS